MKRLMMMWAAAVLASLALPGLVWAQGVKVGSGGKIEIRQGGAVEATGQVHVAGTGTPEIALSNGGALRLGSGIALTVGDGTNPGKLSAAGTAAPVITNRGTGNYAFTVNSTGTLAVTSLQILHADSNGLTLQAGSTPGTLSGITFDSIVASGTYIRFLHTSGSFAVSNCVFNDTDSAAPYNISTVAGTSALVTATVNNTGSRAGFAYENDHGAGIDNSMATSTINWGGETSEPPPAPGGLAGASQSTTQIQWSWNDVTGETSYELQDDADVVKDTSDANVVTITEGSLSENTLTSRHVNAVNAAGPSPDSDTVAKYTKVQDPVAGDFSLAVISSTQIDVSIVAPPNGTVGQTGTEIDRSPDGSSWATIRTFLSTYSYSDTGLSPNTTYFYRVRFRNGDAVVTAYSPSKSAATPAVPPPGAPLLTSPASGSTTNDPTPTLSGTAPPGSIVRVFDGLVEIFPEVFASTIADGSGNWSFTPNANLSVDVHHLTVESSQGYWKLDETSGTASVEDSSGHENNGTHVGDPTPSEDVATVLFQNDGSLQFNGSNQYVALENPTSLNISGQITMAAWVKRATSGYNIIFAHTQAPATLPNVTFYSSSDVYVAGTYDAGGGGHVVATGQYPGDVNQWVHFAAVYDGTTWRLYRNGTEIASAANATGAIPIAGNWAIGAAGTGNYGFFNGKIDDARIYNRGLSPAEVAALAQGKPAAATTITDITITTESPAAPVIISPSNGAILATTTPMVSGTSARDGLLIKLYANDVLRGSVTSGAGGEWSLSPDPALSEGTCALTATATDGSGNTSPASDAVAVTIDVTPPLVSSPSPADGTTVSSSTPAISASWSDSGSGLNLTTVAITFDGSSITAGCTIAESGFGYTPTSALSAAEHTIVMQVLDAAGNQGSLSWSFTVAAPDETPPVITDLYPANGSYTNDTMPILSAVITDTDGTGIDESSIVLRLDGVGVSADTWLSDPDTAIVSYFPLEPLSEGAHTVSVDARDLADNAAPTASATFTVDITPPVATTQVEPTDPLQVEKTVTVTFQGAVAATRIVLVDLVDRTGDGQFQGDTWTLTETFPLGFHSVIGEAQDEAGNIGQSYSGFDVQGPPPDLRNPSIAFVFPEIDLSKVVGTPLHVVVRARDDVDKADTGIASVALLVNDQIVETKTAAAAQDYTYYVFSLNIAGTPASTMAIKARAMDNAANTAETPIRTITVAEAPAMPPVAFKVEVPATITAGQAFDAQLTPVNAAGETVTGLAGTVEIRRTSSPYAITVAFDGSANTVVVPMGSINYRQVYGILASSLDHPEICGSAVIQVNAAAPSSIVLNLVNFQRLAQDTPLTELGARVTDSYGNLVSNVSADWGLVFSQEGTPIVQLSGTALTNANGIAMIPATSIPGNATQLNATAALTDTPTVQTAYARPTVPSVLFNIAFQHQTVEAGMPVSFTITAIDPTTGAVKTDYTGTVYIYRFESSLYTNVEMSGMDSVPHNETTFSVTFTTADEGVLFVQDGICIEPTGVATLVASTRPPVITSTHTYQVVNPQGQVFGTYDIAQLNLSEVWTTNAGFANDLMVLSARPAKILASISTFPPVASGALLDRYGNGVFNERLRMAFTVDNLTDVFVETTGLHGSATAQMRMDLSITESHAFSLTVSAPTYTSIAPVTVTSNTGPLADQRVVLGPTTPTTLDILPDPQAVPSMTVTVSGQTNQEYINVWVYLQLKTGVPNTATDFNQATFNSESLELRDPLSLSPTVMTLGAHLKNTVALPSDGYYHPYSYTFSLTDVTVNTRESSTITGTGGRLLVSAGSLTSSYRTLAYFHSMHFAGAVVGSVPGQEGLPGVFLMDSENAARTMGARSMSLISSEPSGGTFRVEVVDQAVEASPNASVLLESLTAEGEPLLNPITQEALPGTTITVSLMPSQEEGGAHLIGMYATGPILAVDKGWLSDEAIGGKPGQVVLTSQSSVPADASGNARVNIRVTYEDGTPVTGATVTLSTVAPLLAQEPTISQPGDTDATGTTQAHVRSSVAGTLHLKAVVNAPALDDDHPAFNTDTELTPLRILFFSNVHFLTAVPGGKVRATLQEVAFDAPTKEAVVLGVEIRVKPQEEGAFRPMPYAVVKGTAPQVEFRFVPSIEPFLAAGPQVVVDDGSDETSLDRPLDPSRRTVSLSYLSVDEEANTVTWTPSMADTPFAIGANRLFLWVRNDAPGATGYASGFTIATARMLVYTAESSCLADPRLDNRPDSFVYDADNGDHIKQSVLCSFPTNLSDPEISDTLAQLHLAPCGIIRGDAMVQAWVPNESSLHGTLAKVAEMELAIVTSIEPLVDTLSVGAEELPDWILAGYDKRTGGFCDVIDSSTTAGDTLTGGKQHFLMHTFAAHRLAAAYLQPTVSATHTTCVTIVDTGIGKGSLPARFADKIIRLAIANGEGRGDKETIYNAAVVELKDGDMLSRLQTREIHDVQQGGKGHGTAAAFLVVGDGDANAGDTVIGTAKHMTKISIVKAFAAGPRLVPVTTDQNVNPQTQRQGLFRILVALRYELAQKPIPDIVNLSLGHHFAGTPTAYANLAIHLERAFDAAAQAGVIIVAGSGPSAIEQREELARKPEAHMPRWNVSGVPPASLAPIRGFRSISKVDDAINVITASQQQDRHLTDVSSPLVVTVAGSVVEHASGKLVEKSSPAANGGNRVSLTASGRDILSMRADGTLGLFSGSSFTAPTVSGILAEMIVLDRVLGRPQTLQRRKTLIEILEATSDPVSPSGMDAFPALGDEIGFGRVNAWKAILAVLNDGISAEDDRRVTVSYDAGTAKHPQGVQQHLIPDPFPDVSRRDKLDPDMNWYGFQVRTRVRNAHSRIETRTPHGAPRLVQLQDASNSYPVNSQGSGEAPHAYAGLRFGEVLPAGVMTNDPPNSNSPVGVAVDGFFEMQFSAQREDATNVGVSLEPNRALQVCALGDERKDGFYRIELDLQEMRTVGKTADNVTFDDSVFTIDIPKLDLSGKRVGQQDDILIGNEALVGVAQLANNDGEIEITAVARRLTGDVIGSTGVRVESDVNILLSAGDQIDTHVLSLTTGAATGIAQFRLKKTADTIMGTGGIRVIVDGNGDAALKEEIRALLVIGNP